MAKSGTITALSGSSVTIKNEVAASDPKVASLGAVVADALAANPAKSIVYVNTKTRKVAVIDPASTPGVDLAGFFGDIGTAKDTLLPDEAKRSTPFTRDAGDDTPITEALTTALEPVKPSYTVGSLMSKLEDILSVEGKDAVVKIDQVFGGITIYSGAPGDIDGQDISDFSAPVPLAVFEQSVETSTGPKDPFE